MTIIGSPNSYPSVAAYDASRRSLAGIEGSYAKISEQESASKSVDSESVEAIEADTDVGVFHTSGSANLQGKLVTLSSLQKGSDVAEPTPVWGWPDDQYEEYMETERGFIEMEKRALEIAHTQYFNPTTDPRVQTYANIIVDGNVVATVDNQGVVKAEDERLKQMLQDLMNTEVDGISGPDLAQAKAEEIAKLLGGTVATADTAIDQVKFDQLNAAVDYTDYDAIERDPLYKQLQIRFAELEEIETNRSRAW